MPGEEYSDDYVAQLLAKDAKSSAKNYSYLGLQALLPKRSVNNAPKPNTRFLKNILKETDSHNAALKAKEEQEARVRLRQLGRSSNDGTSKPEPSKVKKHEEADKHRSKRRKVDEINDILNGRPKKRENRHSETQTKALRDREQTHHSGAGSSEEEEKRRGHQGHRHRRKDGHRHRSDTEEEPKRERTRHHRRSRRRSRSRSPHKDDNRSKRHTRDRSISSLDHAAKSKPQSRHEPSHRSRKTSPIPTTPSPNDSDPLESLGLIGPAPPRPPQIHSRGRGAFASTAAASTIDHHFKSTYDPSIDTAVPDAVEVGGDDWDQALEALKDRQQWQQNQAERLRMAGFSEAEIEKWGKGRSGGEGEVEDVRWRERGEGREWDRGKVVGGEGEVETGNVEWGRLKGT